MLDTIKKTTRKSGAKSSKSKKSTSASQAMDSNNEKDYHQMIAIAAYYRAEKRDLKDGDAVQDWLEAEAEINSTRRAL